jgi:hypothetical protein
MGAPVAVPTRLIALRTPNITQLPIVTTVIGRQGCLSRTHCQSAIRNLQSVNPFVPVVQRIERRFPKPLMWVRFPPGTYSVLLCALDDAGAIALPRTSIDSNLPILGLAAGALRRLCRTASRWLHSRRGRFSHLTIWRVSDLAI